MKPHVVWFVMGLILITSAPTLAQTGGGPNLSNAANILNTLPPDLYSKIQQLSLILDQHIKSGNISEAQIQQQLLSGQLEPTIRSLSPEASQLLDEINADMQSGKGPGEDALLPLLGGLSGVGK
ncbi:MAG TPA: hypothetical protein VIR79_07455 [Nitrospira sp.]